MKVSKDRNYVNMQVNPCKMCMPMGASLALKGIKKAMNIIHGSQGCSTYIRRHMAAHYNEPIDIASSSLSEEGTVYGGASNLKIGISNMVKMYEPEVVGVLTTCLAETIGDDIERIVKEVRKESAFDEVDIIPIPTPGYGGSQSEGYFMAIRALVKYYAEKDHSKIQYSKGGFYSEIVKAMDPFINIIVSNATCEDIRELKRVVKLLGIKAKFIPDISDVLDAPYSDSFNKLPLEGSSREDMMKMSHALATIELGGDLVEDRYSPAHYLHETFNVPAYRMPLPIGIHHMDRFVETILNVFGIVMPKELENERGRLIDGMIDSHKHSALGRVAVYGDMDLVYGISALMVENGVQVKVASTGTQNKRFRSKTETLFKRYKTEGLILQDSDFETIRDVIKKRRCQSDDW